MANMIEQSLLCKVLDAPDLEILHSNGSSRGDVSYL